MGSGLWGPLSLLAGLSGELVKDEGIGFRRVAFGDDGGTVRGGETAAIAARV